MHLVRSGLPFKRTAEEELTAHCPCLSSNVSFFMHSCGVLSLELFIDGAGNVGLAQHKGAFSFSYNITLHADLFDFTGCPGWCTLDKSGGLLETATL